MIRFAGQIIEVKKLIKPTSKFTKASSSKQKFIKIAIDGEENQIPGLDLSNIIDDSSTKIDTITDRIWSLIQDFERQLMYGKPDKYLFMERQEFTNEFLNKLSNPDKMDPFEYMEFLQLAPVGRRVIFNEVGNIYASVPVDFRPNSDELNEAIKLQEIYIVMEYKKTNPFNYDDIRNVVSEIVTNNYSGRF
jgi:hypothetical protein